jgi:hypothetical protein
VVATARKLLAHEQSKLFGKALSHEGTPSNDVDGATRSTLPSKSKERTE